ncbi:MAG: Xaa-Pro peptidase family protein [Gemmataceae bacterium]|nr:Xaa-Pro peptidase family protein [Gemmataceae bacterium]MDW8266866.1 Xaa-Pro peptidase family protein [Gemmataceae bacterium]
MEYPSRRQRLLEALAAEDLDALLVSHPVNVTYLTGFTGESSHLILGRQRTLLVSDGRFTQQLAEECPDLEVRIRPPRRALIAAVAETLQALGLRRVGFESNHLTVAEYETLREQAATIDWKPGRDRVERLRAVKDADEVAAIRNAIAIAEQAFAVFRANLRPEATEKELHDQLEAAVRQAGGRSTSFPSIVAVGERSALPHAPPTGRRLGDGDFVLVDWGAVGGLYHSDLTRVVAIRRILPKLEQVYAVALTAQERALRAIRPGVKAADVDAEARAAIAAAGFGDFFTHSLGHGIGLQIHEAPWLRAGSDDTLLPGMVVTIEPGIYLPGWGGVRIEDDVLVTADGAEVLSRLPRELSAWECRW